MYVLYRYLNLLGYSARGACAARQGPFGLKLALLGACPPQTRIVAFSKKQARWQRLEIEPELLLNAYLSKQDVMICQGSSHSLVSVAMSSREG